MGVNALAGVFLKASAQVGRDIAEVGYWKGHKLSQMAWGKTFLSLYTIRTEQWDKLYRSTLSPTLKSFLKKNKTVCFPKGLPLLEVEAPNEKKGKTKVVLVDSR